MAPPASPPLLDFILEYPLVRPSKQPLPGSPLDHSKVTPGCPHGSSRSDPQDTVHVSSPGHPRCAQRAPWEHPLVRPSGQPVPGSLGSLVSVLAPVLVVVAVYTVALLCMPVSCCWSDCIMPSWPSLSFAVLLGIIFCWL